MKGQKGRMTEDGDGCGHLCRKAFLKEAYCNHLMLSNLKLPHSLLLCLGPGNDHKIVWITEDRA